MYKLNCSKSVLMRPWEVFMNCLYINSKNLHHLVRETNIKYRKSWYSLFYEKKIGKFERQLTTHLMLFKWKKIVLWNKQMKGLKLSKLLFTFLQCVILHFNDSFLSCKDKKEVIPSPKLHNFSSHFYFVASLSTQSFRSIYLFVKWIKKSFLKLNLIFQIDMQRHICALKDSFDSALFDAGILTLLLNFRLLPLQAVAPCRQPPDGTQINHNHPKHFFFKVHKLL